MRKVRIVHYLFTIGLMGCLCSSTVSAEPVKSAFVEVDLITDVRTIQPGTPFWIGLHMDMDDQWQVYWKNPGDSGLPVTIEWDLPDGFEAGEIYWPYPIKMDYPELTTYNYMDEVILLSQLKPPVNLAMGSIQEIKANVKWLSCLKMCVQGQVDLSLELTVKKEKPAFDIHIQEMFKTTMVNWPLSESGMSMKVERLKGLFYLYFIPQNNQNTDLTNVDFFPDRQDLIDHTEEQFLEPIGEGYRLVLTQSSFVGEDVAQFKGVLVLRGKVRRPEDKREEFEFAFSVDLPINNINEGQ